MMDWREARSTRMARWAAGLILVAAAHAAAATAFLWRGEPEDDPDGVFVIDLAPVTTSAHMAAHLSAPGPESVDAVAARPAAPLQDTPGGPALRLPPPPRLPDLPPDLVLPERAADSPAKTAEPEPELPRQKAVVPPSPASAAARPLQIEDAPRAAQSAAPMRGSSDKDVRTRTKWQRDVVAHLGRYKSYPPAARNRRETGEIVLKFALDRSGLVSNAAIARTSGSPRLDAAALEMLRRASPLPPPPEDVPGAKIELTIPVKFHFKD